MMHALANSSATIGMIVDGGGKDGVVKNKKSAAAFLV